MTTQQNRTSLLAALQDAVVSGSRLGAYGNAGNAMPGELQTLGLCLLHVQLCQLY
jgi:hypothetical protein